MGQRITKRDERYLTRCRERVTAAQRWRKDESYDDLWGRLIDLYAGKHWPKGLTDEDRIAVNVCFATINVIAPSVSINNPKIVVDAKRPEDFNSAVITEAVVNYWWKHYDVHEQFRRAVDDFLMIGFGWLKTGYRYVEEEADDPDGYNEEVSAANADADAFALDNPHMAHQLPTPEEIAASVPSTRLNVVEDRPFVERVSPYDVFVDPEATCLSDARWIAQRVIRGLDEIRADDTYDPKARKEAQADARIKDSMRPESASHRDPTWQRATVWEFYDLKTGDMCVFADAGDGYLIAPEKQPYTFGHPFVMLRNYDVPDVFYPMGELEAIEGLQHELNATRTAQLNDRKQKRRAWLYNPNAFDRKGKTELASNKDNRMIPVTGNVPLNEAVTALPSQQLDPQMYQNSDVIEADINEITGLTEYARGGEQAIRRTATEASIIQDAAASRAADKLAKVEKVIAVVARRLVQLAQQYLTEPDVVRITGMNGKPVWVEFHPEDVQGEYDFDVEGGSTQPLNESGRRAQASQLLQTLAPLMVPNGPVNTTEVLRFVLTSYGIKDAARFLNQQEDPALKGLGAPPEMEGDPPADQPPDPSQVPPDAGMAPSPEGMPPGGPSQEAMLSQLGGQVGLNLGG